MLLQYLLEDLTNVEISGDTNQEINKIEYDSKKIEKGDVFVAINGYKEDGKEYIDEAIKRGAVAVVYEGETQKRENYLKINMLSDNNAILIGKNGRTFFKKSYFL